MRRVGLLAPFFPPLRRVGALRPGRWAAHFEEFDWEPWIVTLASQSEEYNSLGIDTSRILSLNHLRNTSSPKADPSFGMMRAWLDARVPYDGFWPIFWWNQQSIKRWFQDTAKIECIVSTGDPWSSHWMGKQVARELDIPWLADFRDPWSLSRVPLRNRSMASLAKDAHREADIVLHADAMTFTSDTALERYQKAYPAQSSSMGLIYNSAGSLDYDNKPHTHTSEVSSNERVQWVFFGSFRRLSPIEPWINVFRQVTKIALEKRITIPPVTLRSNNVSLHSLDEFTWIEHEPLPSVDSNNGASILEQASLLLLSSHPDRDDVIPAKLWDYLPSSAPIISLGSSADVKKILQETEKGSQFDSRKDDQVHAASQWLLDHILGISKQPPPLSDEWMHAIDPKTMTSKLCELLDTITKQSSQPLKKGHSNQSYGPKSSSKKHFEEDV